MPGYGSPVSIRIETSNYATFGAASNTAITFTFVYDLSGLRLGAADTRLFRSRSHGRSDGLAVLSLLLEELSEVLRTGFATLRWCL